jgi:hypothetical protein
VPVRRRTAACRRGPRYRREPSKERPHAARASPQQWYYMRSAPLDCRRLRSLTCIAVIADQVVFWSPDYSANPEDAILNGCGCGFLLGPWSGVYAPGTVCTYDCCRRWASRFCETLGRRKLCSVWRIFQRPASRPTQGGPKAYLRLPRPSATRCWLRASPSGFVHMPWDPAQ